MNYNAPGRCPVCDHELEITKLSCNHCRTTIEGKFSACKFCKLPKEQLDFLEAFIKCRGNIKDMEKELNISYPTVRNRLDGIIQALGYKVEKVDTEEEKDRRQEILKALEAGEITPQEASRQLRKSGGR